MLNFQLSVRLVEWERWQCHVHCFKGSSERADLLPLPQFSVFGTSRRFLGLAFMAAQFVTLKSVMESKNGLAENVIFWVGATSTGLLGP